MAWDGLRQGGCMCMEFGRSMFDMRTERDGMGWMSLRMLFWFGLMGDTKNVDPTSLRCRDARCKCASYSRSTIVPPIPILPCINQYSQFPHITPLNHLPYFLTPLFPFGPVNPGLAVKSYEFAPAPIPVPEGNAAVPVSVALAISSAHHPVPLWCPVWL